MAPRVSRIVWNGLRITAASVCFATTIGYPAWLPGEGSEPGRLVFVRQRNRLLGQFSPDVTAGQEVLVAMPSKPGAYEWKRIIGTHQAVVMSRAGQVVVVPPHRVWVEGGEEDSCSFGTLPASMVHGIVVAELYPSPGAVSPATDIGRQQLGVAAAVETPRLLRWSESPSRLLTAEEAAGSEPQRQDA